MINSNKYCRSLHGHISEGTTSDDRIMPDGYINIFMKFDKLVLTEKIDGQNNCFNKYGLYARSHSAPSKHPWDKPLIKRWKLLKNDLGNLEIFGENTYGIHSIAYKNLESYFYVFAIREKDTWLSWEEVKFYSKLFDFPTVPEIPIIKQLFEVTSQSERLILETWLKYNLGMSWLEYVKTSGALGGFDLKTGEDCCEGLVVRNADSFKTNNGLFPVLPNEFDSLFKLVRKSHVKTDEHWTKNWKPSTLKNYEKYGWSNYQYLERK